MVIFDQKLTVWPISLNLFIGFHYFCIFKLHLWSITIITQWKFWQKSFWPFFGPFLTKICPFWPKNWHFGQFLPINSKDFANFAYSNYFYGLLLELSSESFDKKLFHPFLALFYPNLSVLTTKNVILAHFSHSAHRILLLFHIKTILMVFYYDYLGKVLRKVCFALFLTRFWAKNVQSDPKIDILDNFSLFCHNILLLIYI